MSKKHKQAAPVSLSISQNFLTSKRTIERLLRLTNINKRDTVIEIGAGKGHITKALLGKCGCVIASEIDPKLYESLRCGFAQTPNLRLLNADFLRSPLPQSVYKVFSNIPFAITTDIVKKLTQGKNPPRDMKYGLNPSFLTKQQIAAALRRAKLAPLQVGGEIQYIQWLCLFRCWRRFSPSGLPSST
jgi:16S rRNA A1518/A1519 N6-dimethyltransferase RsmA/KsgA/DIM1 with predicted DNA glycosylase/AP lyase activity